MTDRMRVSATDVYGDRLPTAAMIVLERQGSSQSRSRQVARDVPPHGRAEFDADPVHHYRIVVTVPGFGRAVRTVPGTIDELVVAVPIAPEQVVGFRWPDPLPEIPGVLLDIDTPQEQVDGVVWELLDDVRRGALLNIWSKLWTVTVGMSPAATYIVGVIEVREDRIIAEVADDLPTMLAAAVDIGDLDEVSAALHEPPASYTRGISVKSKDEPNIQISTFVDFVTPRPPARRKPTLADIDIDEARGIEHAGDVIEHAVTGRKTDPVEIHGLLVVAGVDPGWKPLIA